MLQDFGLGRDTVDVSMETLAPLWVCDPHDLSDLREEREEPPSVWGPQCVFNSPPPPPPAETWTEQLTPHLQRNKQLQDTLLQREEELARLQEENNKLRQFFNSSFVRNLQLKAKKLSADGRRKLKRNLMFSADGPLQTCGHQLFTSQQISKRVCRNLTAEFCSESSETSSSEPNLDLWVLRTLGLKDRDTIDTSDACSDYSLSTLVYNHAASSSSPSEYSSSFSSSFSSSSTSSPVLSCGQRSTPQADHGYGTIEYQEANCGSPTKSTSPGQRSDFTASGGQFGSPDAVIRSCDTLTAVQAPPRDPPFNQTPDHFQTTASSPVQTLEGNPTSLPAYWSPLRCSQTPSQDAVQFSPPGERVHFSPIACSSPVKSQFRTPIHGSSPTSPSAGSLPPTRPQTPHGRTDLAFSMSLSPSSSVKTHSFPQGQAFVRKDNGGRWNFTWVPKQGP